MKPRDKAAFELPAGRAVLETQPDPIATLRQRWPVLLIGLLLFAVLGWAIAGLQTADYVSSTEVTLQALDGAALSSHTRTNAERVAAMNSEAASVASGRVVRIVSAKLGYPLSVGTSAIRTHVITNTYTIVIDFHATKAALAERGAAATAQAFLEARADTAHTAIVQEVRSLDEKLAAAASQLAKAPTVRAQVIRYASRLAALGPQLRDLRTVDIDPGTVTSDPSTPSANHARLLYTLIGAAVGLVAAGGFILWRARHDGYVRGASLAGVDGCPVLGVIEPESGKSSSHANENAYRCIRTALVARASGGRTVAISSADSEAAPTPDVAGGLVRSLSAAAFDARQVTTEELPVTGDALAGPQLRALLREFAGRCDFVITETEPAATSSGEAVGRAAGTVLLTAIDGRTTLRRCRQSLARLRRLGVEVPGIVVLMPVRTL